MKEKKFIFDRISGEHHQFLFERTRSGTYATITDSDEIIVADERGKAIVYIKGYGADGIKFRQGLEETNERLANAMKVETEWEFKKGLSREHSDVYVANRSLSMIYPVENALKPYSLRNAENGGINYRSGYVPEMKSILSPRAKKVKVNLGVYLKTERILYVMDDALKTLPKLDEKEYDEKFLDAIVVAEYDDGKRYLLLGTVIHESDEKNPKGVPPVRWKYRLYKENGGALESVSQTPFYTVEFADEGVFAITEDGKTFFENVETDMRYEGRIPSFNSKQASLRGYFIKDAWFESDSVLFHMVKKQKSGKIAERAIFWNTSHEKVRVFNTAVSFHPEKTNRPLFYIAEKFIPSDESWERFEETFASRGMEVKTARFAITLPNGKEPTEPLLLIRDKNTIAKPGYLLALTLDGKPILKTRSGAVRPPIPIRPPFVLSAFNVKENVGSMVLSDTEEGLQVPIVIGKKRGFVVPPIKKENAGLWHASVETKYKTEYNGESLFYVRNIMEEKGIYTILFTKETENKTLFFMLTEVNSRYENYRSAGVIWKEYNPMAFVLFKENGETLVDIYTCGGKTIIDVSKTRYYKTVSIGSEDDEWTIEKRGEGLVIVNEKSTEKIFVFGKNKKEMFRVRFEESEKKRGYPVVIKNRKLIFSVSVTKKGILLSLLDPKTLKETSEKAEIGYFSDKAPNYVTVDSFLKSIGGIEKAKEILFDESLQRTRNRKLKPKESRIYDSKPLSR